MMTRRVFVTALMPFLHLNLCSNTLANSETGYTWNNTISNDKSTVGVSSFTAVPITTKGANSAPLHSSRFV